jgi:NitT/TauT family transport system substrate-binding protein
VSIVPRLVLIAALACAAASAQAESIKVGISKLLGYPAVPIAIERGYFKAQDLDVEMVYFDSAQPISVGVASGDLDFGVSGMSAGFYSLAAQGQLRLIASAGGEGAGFHAMVYLASAKAYDAGLVSPRDFDGHSVAITQLGTSLHYSIGLVADKFGFPLSTVTVKPLQSNTNIIAALGGGTVDAAVLPQSTALRAMQQAGAKRIGWVSDFATSLGSASTCFTATKTANNRGDLVKRFLIAYRQGARDFHDAFVTPGGQREDGPLAPTILAIMANFTGLAPQEIDDTIPYLEPEGRIDASSIASQIAWYKAQNLLKADVKAEDIIDRRYAALTPSR